MEKFHPVKEDGVETTFTGGIFACQANMPPVTRGIFSFGTTMAKGEIILKADARFRASA